MSRRAHRPAPGEEGFSLVEMLIAVGVMLAVTGGIFSVMNPIHGAFQAQPELSDMQQRLRVSTGALYRDLLMAGAGSDIGSQRGSLGDFFAAVLPFRRGLVKGDRPGTFTSDTITILYVPLTSSQTTISQPMPAGSGEARVNAGAGCPIDDPLCGFAKSMDVVIYDDRGPSATFTVTALQDGGLTLRHNQVDSSTWFGAGAKIAQLTSATYWLNATTNQLMHYDGSLSDVPVADNVVSLRFEYYGEPQPPTLKHPGGDDDSMTYGPKPPPLEVPSGTYWPPGESCTVQVIAGVQTARLETLGAGSRSLVRLDEAILTDGPWCPDPDEPNRWDADLLRVRTIRVTIRVQSALAALRGRGPLLFKNPGTASIANHALPDHEIRFDVTPRNLNFGR